MKPQTSNFQPLGQGKRILYSVGLLVLTAMTALALVFAVINLTRFKQYKPTAVTVDYAKSELCSSRQDTLGRQHHTYIVHDSNNNAYRLNCVPNLQVGSTTTIYARPTSPDAYPSKQQLALFDVYMVVIVVVCALVTGLLAWAFKKRLSPPKSRKDPYAS